VYKDVSSRIRDIFRRYTDIIEPLSLDEAYLDVTEDKQGIGSAIEIATMIKKSIREELSLTASAGVSVNKFIAKIASDLHKPNGLTFIGPSRVESFMESLPVEKFFGVGKVTAEKMKRLGLFSGADLKKLSIQQLTDHFGKSGKFYYNIVRGIDDRIVQPYRETKSVGAEDTFSHDLKNTDDMYDELDKLADIVSRRLIMNRLEGKTITLKIKYSDFKKITRSQSLINPTADAQTIKSVARDLLISTDLAEKRIRLLGITLSNFGDHDRKEDQLALGL
jgi:DNA polymerase-4